MKIKKVLSLVLIFSILSIASAQAAGERFGFLRSQKEYKAVKELVSNAVTLSATGLTENLLVTTTNMQRSFSNDVVRKVTVALGGTAANIKANATTNATIINKVLLNPNTTDATVLGSYWIYGTDVNGKYMVESLGFAENAASTQTSLGAYKDFTVNIPGKDGYTVTMDVGFTDAFGLKRKIESATDMIAVYDGTTIESTRATVATSTTVKGRNTFDPNTAADGSKDFTIWYLTTDY